MISSWRSIFALIVFLLTNLVGVFPLYITVPLPAPLAPFTAKLAEYFRLCLPSQSCCQVHPSICRPNPSEAQRKVKLRWHRIAINFQTAPLAAVLLLLATGILHGSDVREGIVGSESSGIRPLDIMALFISLAYLSISLDTTGLFRFLAFWVVRKGGSSGRRLYWYLYIFFLISATLVGNDPVVLFGTPFLAYFSRVSGVIPTAWIFAQFTTANLASAVLPSSNLTNLVLAGAFSFSFISFAAHTILPTLAAGIAVFPVLAFLLFASRELVPREINVVELQHSVSENDSGSSRDTGSIRHAPGDLTDKKGAIFGSVLLGVTLCVLIGTSPLKVPVWQVTVPPALIMLGRDIWHDRKMWRKRAPTSGSLESGPAEPNDQTTQMELQPVPKSSEPDISCNATQPDREKRSTVLCYIQNVKTETLPTVMTILPRLPISLVLFAFCMFILVQALTTSGWVEVFAGWWSAWIRVCEGNGMGSAVVGAIGGMLVISVLLCNICGTNIGATILLARVLQFWLSSSSSTVDNKLRVGSIFALALGTNFGAFTFSFSASLAGLLWRDILRQKGISVRQRQFAALNLPIVGAAVVSAGAVLVAEVYVVGR